MSEELKPCPFCGSKDLGTCTDRVVGDEAYRVVICGNCYAQSRGCLHDSETAGYWNRRAAPEPAQGDIVPVDQTVFGYPNGNCYSACLASILRIPLESVPHFFEPSEGREQSGWNTRVNKFLERFGLWRLVCKPVEFSDVPAHAVTILAGSSPNFPDTTHAVVGHGLVIAHDPNPSRKGLEGTWRDWEVEFFIPLTPKSIQAADTPAPSDVEPLLQRARNWIEAIDVRYGPSHYSLAALLAQVRAEERERCAKVCDDLSTDKARCAELQLTEQAWEEATERCGAAIRKGEP